MVRTVFSAYSGFLQGFFPNSYNFHIATTLIRILYVNKYRVRFFDEWFTIFFVSISMASVMVFLVEYSTLYFGDFGFQSKISDKNHQILLFHDTKQIFFQSQKTTSTIYFLSD